MVYLFAGGNERQPQETTGPARQPTQALGQASERDSGRHLPLLIAHNGEDVTGAEAIHQRPGAVVHRAPQHPNQQSQHLLASHRKVPVLVVSVATELDGHGIAHGQIAEMCKLVRVRGEGDSK